MRSCPLTWGAAFTFGAIVSPTDPLAAITIARRLGVPRRMTVLIEGESLINDGTALVCVPNRGCGRRRELLQPP
jgi:NhaP-type Na+/H+ or K+/H+ antiporter